MKSAKIFGLVGIKILHFFLWYDKGEIRTFLMKDKKIVHKFKYKLYLTRPNFCIFWETV